MLCLGRGKQSLHFFLTEALLLREKCAGKKAFGDAFLSLDLWWKILLNASV